MHTHRSIHCRLDFGVVRDPAWAAANGDQLFTTVTGQGVITEGTSTSVETHIITGGTGRFARVSGSITVERSIDLQTSLSSASFTGTINLGH